VLCLVRFYACLVCTRTQTQTHPHPHTHTHPHTHKYIHTHTHTKHKRTHPHIHTQTTIHTSTRTHIHTHTHTHRHRHTHRTEEHGVIRVPHHLPGCCKSVAVPCTVLPLVAVCCSECCSVCWGLQVPCYITIQSQTYVISTFTFIHSHARQKSLLYNTIDATFLILLWVGGVCIDLPVSCPPHSRADTHTYGGGVSIRVHLILWGVCPTVYDGFYVE